MSKFLVIAACCMAILAFWLGHATEGVLWLILSELKDFSNK